MSLFFVELPFVVSSTLCFCVPFYWSVRDSRCRHITAHRMVGFKATGFGFFLLIVLTFQIYSVIVGQLIVCHDAGGMSLIPSGGGKQELGGGAAGRAGHLQHHESVLGLPRQRALTRRMGCGAARCVTTLTNRRHLAVLRQSDHGGAAAPPHPALTSRSTSWRRLWRTSCTTRASRATTSSRATRRATRSSASSTCTTATWCGCHCRAALPPSRPQWRDFGILAGGAVCFQIISFLVFKHKNHQIK